MPKHYVKKVDRKFLSTADLHGMLRHHIGCGNGFILSFNSGISSVKAVFMIKTTKNTEETYELTESEFLNIVNVDKAYEPVYEWCTRGSDRVTGLWLIKTETK